MTVDYILNLISSLINSNEKLVKKKKKQISDLINSEITLRSKRELIEKFIDQRLEGLKDEDELIEAFDSFWADEKRKAFDKICADENLDKNNEYMIYCMSGNRSRKASLIMKSLGFKVIYHYKNGYKDWIKD